MLTGTIKLFVSDRGFGFIQPDDGGEDAFVHIRALAASGLGEPREGDRLSYELEPDKRSGKMRAVRLKVAR